MASCSMRPCWQILYTLVAAQSELFPKEHMPAACLQLPACAQSRMGRTQYLMSMPFRNGTDPDGNGRIVAYGNEEIVENCSVSITKPWCTLARNMVRSVGVMAGAGFGGGTGE